MNYKRMVMREALKEFIKTKRLELYNEIDRGYDTLERGEKFNLFHAFELNKEIYNAKMLKKELNVTLRGGTPK